VEFTIVQPAPARGPRASAVTAVAVPGEVAAVPRLTNRQRRRSTRDDPDPPRVSSRSLARVTPSAAARGAADS
jgi:hypothetical protein